MQRRILAGALGGLFLAAAMGQAQTAQIQQQVEKKLDELRKDQKQEQASLDQLLLAALKNNADIRVAEAKLREADAELYRARMNVLKRISMLQQEIKALKAAADVATAEYERTRRLSAQQVIDQGQVDVALKAVIKTRADLAAAEAERDVITGLNGHKLAGGAVAAPVPDNANAKPAPADAAPAPREPLPEALIEKFQKALNEPFKSGPKDEGLTADALLRKLRESARGINVLGKIQNGNEEVTLQFKEPILLGALFQWAEDQLDWRFVVRAYGIVAVPRDAVPPGATLLSEIWPPQRDGQ